MKAMLSRHGRRSPAWMLLLTLSGLSVSFGGVAETGAAEKLVIEAGRIITQAGPEIVNGVIVIENGRITEIGPAGEVDKPWDAPVIGGPELVAFPGFVEAHTYRGMDRANENIDVTPFLDIRDSIDPVAFFYEDCLRYGITTINVQQGNNCVIGGRGMIVRPVGMTVEEMMVQPQHGLKLSISPKRGKSPQDRKNAMIKPRPAMFAGFRRKLILFLRRYQRRLPNFRSLTGKARQVTARTGKFRRAACDPVLPTTMVPSSS